MNLKLKRFNYMNDAKHIVIYDAGGGELVKVYIDKQIEFSQPILHGGSTWRVVNMVAENFDTMWNIIGDCAIKEA